MALPKNDEKRENQKANNICAKEKRQKNKIK